MTNETVISVRSNCDFSLNYQTGDLTPKAEIILITSSVKYEVDKKQSKFRKAVAVNEFRFQADLQSINVLIGELNLVVKNMTTFSQMASSFNAIIQSSKENSELNKHQ